MKQYFQLQFRFLNRKIKAAGVSPILGYVLGLVIFILLSGFLFQKSSFAGYLLVIFALILFTRISEKRRSDFLLITFGKEKMRNIRIVENVLISVPFILVMLVTGSYFEILLLLASGFTLGIYSVRRTINVTIPTPFGAHPFEFTEGFRNTFYAFPLLYGVLVISLIVDNMNLGIFAMILVIFVSMSFYVKPENEYFIWIFNKTPGWFLMNKIKRGFIYATLLNLPILLSLIIFYPDNIMRIGLFYLAGFVFLITVILAKYSDYPNEISFPKGILIAICIYFPPLLLAMIPYFFHQAVKKLKPILYD